MRNTYKTVLVVLLVMNLLANPALLAWGNPPPGRWEKVSQTKPGEKMIVHTKKGGKNTYIYRSLDDQFLHCVHQSFGEMQIELDSVRENCHPKGRKICKKRGSLGSRRWSRRRDGALCTVEGFERLWRIDGANYFCGHWGRSRFPYRCRCGRPGRNRLHIKRSGTGKIALLPVPADQPDLSLA